MSLVLATIGDSITPICLPLLEEEPSSHRSVVLDMLQEGSVQCEVPRRAP